jgi:hypothetical protein
LLSPPDQSRTCDPLPSFSWGRVKLATFYQIQVDDDPGYGSPLLDRVTAQTTFVPDRELPSGTWHWRVRAANSELTGFWSATWSVTVIAVPDAPLLRSPGDGSAVCDPTPTLAWEQVGDAVSYRVQVAQEPGFGAPLLDASTENLSYLSPLLVPGLYYWRVLAKNECGEGVWSDVFRFEVLALPAAPVLLAPPDGSLTHERAPRFSWNGVPATVVYRIQIDDGALFDSPIIQREVATTSFTPAGSLANGTYFWRVQAVSACEAGDWSATWSVTIDNQAPVAVDDRFQVDEDSPAQELGVLANDWDPDGDALRIVRVTQPAHGQTSISDTEDALVYRPEPDYFGPDRLFYTVDDGYGITDTAEVELEVVGINDPPIADAGPDQAAETSTLVTLDGSQSYDPEGHLPLSYFWTQSGGPPVALSSGVVPSPTLIAPSEACTLTFELLVRDALGEASVVPDQMVVTVYSPTIHVLYLATVGRDAVFAPDLVVQSIETAGADLRVAIANQGNAPVRSAFFVDLYIDPWSVPEAVNQTWDQLGAQGAVWGVTGAGLAALAPGGALTLEIGDPYYLAGLSGWPGALPPGTVLYAQVDSFNPGSVYGTVLEGHEIRAGAYNNVYGPVHLTTVY